MKLFSSVKLKSLKDLYIHQLKDLYDAESQLIDALPKMAKKSTNAQLQRAFTDHLAETKGQRDRLKKIFDSLSVSPSGESCAAMEGLVEEGEEILKADAEEEVRDAALIGAAQRVEHYEIAGYGTARALARRLGRMNDVKLLEATLQEEKNADRLLNQIAEGQVNAEAATA